jgi:NAD(P)H-flavin reductase
VSARSQEDILYRDELTSLAGLESVQIHYTLTRSQPDGWTGFTRRVDDEMLAAIGPAPAEQPRAFVCGRTPFVERTADVLVGLGHNPLAIRTEGFGPTGGSTR